MSLKLFTSNMLETLAERLAEILRIPLKSALDEEIILVQSKGMERWISMELARFHGICANCRFPFPNSFVNEMFRIVIPDIPERTLFDPESMTWRIMQILPSCAKKQGFESIRGYMEDTQRNLKRFQLSGRIADTFDQYLLFRPDMISRWETGEEDHWQAVLWRELVKKGNDKDHRVALGKAFLDALQGSHGGAHGFPERVSVFGISALPRFHMQILAGISRFTEVNMFLMNPCREYWGDILSDREIKKTKDMQKDGQLTAEELYLERGNALLSSMGTQGRDFFDLINEFDCEEISSFTDPGEENLLSCIRSDTLNLCDRQDEFNGKTTVSEQDSSIHIHSCHSPMREIEVLHDQLLDMFENNPGLMPGDILVMTPDIEKYAPYIQAVFDGPAGDPAHIPFSIADRTVRKEAEIIDTFLAILDLCGSRFGVTQVLAILESPAVQRKFDLVDEDFELIHQWVKETQIRWGIDGESRSELGLYPCSENTWRAGLDRLLLGYAMPGQNEQMLNGILPFDNIEGGETEILGRFVEFVEQLFTYVEYLNRPRKLKQWAHLLTEILQGFFIPNDDTEREMQIIRQKLGDLEGIQELVDFGEEIDINTIRWHLGHCLENTGFGFGFMTGSVTFCAMLPMRSIPFRITCLVGMNSDDYPRQTVPLGFDLMAKHPRRGDRSRRNDDRYLFLETLLSVREKLYISYVGRNIQDNTTIPPSVMVSELMDYIEEGFIIPGVNIRDHIVTKHRLQAFNPEYFKQGGTNSEPQTSDRQSALFSYSAQNCRAARCLSGERKVQEPFISTGLSEPGEEWRTVDVNDLCRFFGNPARFLLNRRLGIYLEETVVLDDREAFEIKGLERYFLGEDLVKRKLQGQDLTELFPLERASGRLPHGVVGEFTYADLSRGIEGFAEKAKNYMEEKPLDPLEIDLDAAGYRLVGRITDIYPERLIRYRYARLRPVDYITVWIYHLILNLIGSDTYPKSSMLAGLDGTGRKTGWTAWEYSPVDNSMEILEMLLEFYRAGLTKPLHYFSKASWAYAEQLLEKGKSREYALGKARAAWDGNDFNRGDSEDLYCRQCFGNTAPLDSEFCRISEEILGPVLKGLSRD
jgi:exodeoxyribonuclease V gamma subunit